MQLASPRLGFALALVGIPRGPVDSLSEGLRPHIQGIGDDAVRLPGGVLVGDRGSELAPPVMRSQGEK